MVTPPRVLLLALGGTIASVRPDGQAGGAVAPGLGGAALVEAVPGLADVAEIEAQDLPPVASFELGPAEMLDAARRIHAARENGLGGAVVTQGSDTFEETAYMLALTLARSHPVTITGALRNPTLPGADGPANLLAATMAAADPRIAQSGPVVVLNDEIHAARWVAKTHTSRPSTVASPGAGPVGEVVEQRVHLWHAPLYEDYLGMPRDLEGTDVALLRVAAGDDGRLLRGLCEQPPAGVVIEGTGGGHVPAALLEPLDELIGREVPVVVATRCHSGRNLERTYEVPGGEIDLRRRGALLAGWLSGGKARLRLMVGLALGLEPERIFPA